MLNKVQVHQAAIANCITTGFTVPDRSVNKYCGLFPEKLFLL